MADRVIKVAQGRAVVVQGAELISPLLTVAQDAAGISTEQANRATEQALLSRAASRVVATFAERGAIPPEELIPGMRVHVVEAGPAGRDFILTEELEWVGQATAAEFDQVAATAGTAIQPNAPITALTETADAKIMTAAERSMLEKDLPIAKAQTDRLNLNDALEVPAMRPTTSWDDDDERAIIWRDRVTKRALAWLTRSGAMALRGLHLWSPSPLSATRPTAGAQASLRFRAADTGRDALVVERDGQTWIGRLTSDTLARIAAGLGLSATAYRGTGAVIEQYASSDLIRATIKDGDGQLITVAQPLLAAGAQALVWDEEPLACFMAMGQSQLVQSGTDTAIEATDGPRYPHHSVTFSNAASSGSSNLVFDIFTALDEGALNDFAPVRNRSNAFPGLLMQAVVDARADILALTGQRRTGAFIVANARGSMPITRFLKAPTNDPTLGTPYAYANTMKSIRAVKATAARYGRDVAYTVLFAQGEASSGTQAQWRGYFDSIVNDLRADCYADTGRVPVWAVVQTASDDNGSDPNAPEASAQFEAASDAGCAEVYIAAPGYIGRMSDSLHYTSLGRIMLGESVALAHLIHRRTGRFYGCWPRSIVRNGASIVIDYESDGGDVRFDADWVAAVANYGFAYTGAAISAVAKTGPRQITITLASAAAGTLHYANTALETTVDQWSAARGQVYASSGLRSPAALRGRALPADIRFYSPRFSVAL